MSTLRNDRRSFWRQLLAQCMSLKKRGYFKDNDPSMENWLRTTAYKSKKSGQTGFYFGFIINEHEAWVQLYIDDRKGFTGRNQKRYQNLHTQRSNIDNSLGGLEWRGGEDCKTGSIVKLVSNCGLADTAQWNEVQDNMVNEMNRFIHAFEPFIAKM